MAHGGLPQRPRLFGQPVSGQHSGAGRNTAPCWGVLCGREDGGGPPGVVGTPRQSGGLCFVGLSDSPGVSSGVWGAGRGEKKLQREAGLPGASLRAGLEQKCPGPELLLSSVAPERLEGPVCPLPSLCQHLALRGCTCVLSTCGVGWALRKEGNYSPQGSLLVLFVCLKTFFL